MTDLSSIPLAELLLEITRREVILEEEFSALCAWRYTVKVSTECSDIGRRTVTAVAEKFGVSADDIMSRKRTPKIARARMVAMAGLRMAGFSLSETGRFFERDHGTVIHACKTVKNNNP